LTAAEVAAAFANLAEDATFGAAPATNGSYTNGTSGSLGAGYTSGSVSVVDANNAAVVFTTSTWASSATQAITIAGTSGKASQVAVAGVEEVVGVTGRTGVVAGKVVVDGGKTSEITVDGYETASTITANSIETLNLKNSDEDLTVTTSSTESPRVSWRPVGLS